MQERKADAERPLAKKIVFWKYQYVNMLSLLTLLYNLLPGSVTLWDYWKLFALVEMEKIVEI